jgi:glucan phosphoethanolaminetransferase (alkaline phosphatase superfamily)
MTIFIYLALIIITQLLVMKAIQQMFSINSESPIYIVFSGFIYFFVALTVILVLLNSI